MSSSVRTGSGSNLSGVHEEVRLAALRGYGILDTAPEEPFDDITRIAAYICDTPVAVINLLDSDRQWFKSEVGLGVREAPLHPSSAQAILERDFLVVPDLHSDSRFADKPLIHSDPRLRFYAGAVVETPAGVPIGAVAVLDHIVRSLTPAQEDALRALARQVTIQLELRRALAIEHQALLAKDQLLAMIAHELRTPLTTIKGQAEILGRRVDTLAIEDRDAAIADIAESSSRLQELIDNMLVLGHAQSTEDISLEPVLVQRMLPAILKRHVTVRPQAPIETHFADDLPAVLAHSTYFEQVVSNLLVNATKYASAETTIDIHAEVHGGMLEIRVLNQTDQRDLSDLSRLFEPFFRTELAKKRATGLGLGLSVCKRLVEIQGGRIWARRVQPAQIEVGFSVPITTGDSQE